MRQRLFLLATLAVFALPFLSGCGSSGGGGTAATTEGAAAVAATPVSAVEENPFPHVQFSISFADEKGRQAQGEVTIKLNRDKAPLTVENFLKYVEEGFYTDTIIHEVWKGDVIIGGGYSRDLKEKPTNRPVVRNEAHNGVKNARGTVAMLRAPNVIDSSTSQFLFNLADNSYLDPQPLDKDQQPAQAPEKYGYCVFGEVVAGQEVLDKIAEQEVSENGGVFRMMPKHPIVIKEAKRVK
jgi:peptidyl-prolyl cis-trans isomerase A (cyclophilin A)